VEDLRLLPKQQLPGPIFHYIDGAADGEALVKKPAQPVAEQPRQKSEPRVGSKPDRFPAFF